MAFVSGAMVVSALFVPGQVADMTDQWVVFRCFSSWQHVWDGFGRSKENQNTKATHPSIPVQDGYLLQYHFIPFLFGRGWSKLWKPLKSRFYNSFFAMLPKLWELVWFIPFVPLSYSAWELLPLAWGIWCARAQQKFQAPGRSSLQGWCHGPTCCLCCFATGRPYLRSFKPVGNHRVSRSFSAPVYHSKHKPLKSPQQYSKHEEVAPSNRVWLKK